MAMSPRNIMNRLGASLDNPRVCTKKQIRRAFINAGYGSAKADKWINLFLSEDILKPIDTDKDNNILYGCIWWGSV